MGGACSGYGAKERCIQGFGGGNLRERDHFGDPGVDGTIILRWTFRKSDVIVWAGSSWLRSPSHSSDKTCSHKRGNNDH